MNDEISHIAQWQELAARATNFGLLIAFDAEVFYLSKRVDRLALARDAQLGKYLTLADLRAGISDYVAGERAAGRIKG